MLSPGTARHDRVVKRRFYARVGVPEYWMVDVDARLVERALPDGWVEVLDERLTWLPEGAHEPFVLEVPELFADALGEPEAPEGEASDATDGATS